MTFFNFKLQIANFILRYLWEVRSNISDKRIVRVFFTVSENKMILLHAIIKKSQKTPKEDLALAIKRRDSVLNQEV